MAPPPAQGSYPHDSLQQQNHGSKLSISPPGVVLDTKRMLEKHAAEMARRATEHETLINKVQLIVMGSLCSYRKPIEEFTLRVLSLSYSLWIMYSLGVLSFGTFCFLLGSRPQDIPPLYCLFFIIVAPLRWIYYRSKKWHYYLLDFCYYANAIFITMLLFFPTNDKFFMVCFSFSEGPLAWALIVWRCSLVFSSIDKIVSVLIHLLPGTVFFIIRWWELDTFSHHSDGEVGPWPPWPSVENSTAHWTWLFFVPLLAYCFWQALYFLIVEGLRRQRLLNDPEVMTSYRELKRKAERANNIWWRLSGLLGAEKRVYMYALIQAVFTVATLALTVPLFKSYQMHTWFEVFKLSATVWNGGNYIFEVMPRQAVAKNKKKEAVNNSGSQANAQLENDKNYAMYRRASVEDLAESMVLLDNMKSAVHID